MARRKKDEKQAGGKVVDYRHKTVSRLNIPPAGLTARGEIVREKKVRYAYKMINPCREEVGRLHEGEYPND